MSEGKPSDMLMIIEDVPGGDYSVSFLDDQEPLVRIPKADVSTPCINRDSVAMFKLKMVMKIIRKMHNDNVHDQASLN